MDVRTGGKYRLEFGAGGSDTMAFYGKYLEVVPNERIVWTNDEGEEGAITTVTFEDQGGKTLLKFHEVYPSKEALEEALQGSAAALPEQLEQLDELLSSLGK
ncbi:ATPase (plasmid) [Rhizobium leguminosarum bv. trifolii CB782]|nr:ATPase [Rhizobium leguminosarum bv. trifolii CB782]